MTSGIRYCKAESKNRKIFGRSTFCD